MVTRTAADHLLVPTLWLRAAWPAGGADLCLGNRCQEPIFGCGHYESVAPREVLPKENGWETTILGRILAWYPLPHQFWRGGLRGGAQEAGPCRPLWPAWCPGSLAGSALWGPRPLCWVGTPRVSATQGLASWLSRGAASWACGTRSRVLCS